MPSLAPAQRARARHAERAPTRAQALAFHRAAELYRVALELLDAETNTGADSAHSSIGERRAALLCGLADSLAATGHCLDAAQAYQKAAELTPREAPLLERHAADQLLRGGDLQRGSECSTCLERVGQLSSQPVPVAALTFELARLCHGPLRRAALADIPPPRCLDPCASRLWYWW